MTSMRTSVRQVLEHLSTRREFWLDQRRFSRYGGAPDSAVPATLHGRSLEAQVIKDYHRVEKGLSLHAPKRPFGEVVKGRLDTFVPAADRSSERRIREIALLASSAADALEEWNSRGRISDEIAPTMQHPPAFDLATMRSFFSSRRSVRDFDQARSVPRETLATVIEFFQQTPSVCNRQPARVHFYDDREKIAELLSIQAGSSGFRERVPQLAVVTAETDLFTGAGERNQMWIDGALAAMTLVWAFHANGIATCMLNWSKRNTHSDRLRRAGDIPREEAVICLIAFGFAPAEFRVARSPRRPTERVASFHS